MPSVIFSNAGAPRATWTSAVIPPVVSRYWPSSRRTPPLHSCDRQHYRLPARRRHGLPGRSFLPALSLLGRTRPLHTRAHSLSGKTTTRELCSHLAKNRHRTSNLILVQNCCALVRLASAA